VELGCGCGFLAIAALKMYPSLERYFATDGSSTAVEKCRMNLEANFGTRTKADRIWTELIDWEKDEEKFRKTVLELTQDLGPGVLLGAGVKQLKARSNLRSIKFILLHYHRKMKIDTVFPQM
jgi:hypothetical protein